jgi:IS30 family transposase
MSKYGNRAVEIDGYRFASKAEAWRYQELRIMERAGAIRNLEVHPRYPLVVNKVVVGHYEADFTYQQGEDGALETVVEDVKSPPTRTALYRLKRKMMLAEYGIAVREIEA